MFGTNKKIGYVLMDTMSSNRARVHSAKVANLGLLHCIIDLRSISIDLIQSRMTAPHNKGVYSIVFSMI
jgi:hypothetical protein